MADRDLTLRISVKDDGTVVVRKFADSARKSMEGAAKATHEMPASASKSWGSFFTSVGSGFKTVGGYVTSFYGVATRALGTFMHYAKQVGLVGTAALVGLGATIYALDSKILKAGEDFRRFEISMTGVLGSATRARELTQYTLERAMVSPAQSEDLRQVVQSLAMMPSTRIKLLASDFGEVTESLNEMTDTIIGMASMRPDQGIGGALMAVREALGGQWRSFQFRFDLNPDIIAASIGKTLSEITGNTELTQQAINTWREIMIPEETLKEMSRLPSVLIGNIGDAMQIAFKEIGDFGLYDWLVGEIEKISGRIKEVVVEDLGKKGIGAGLAASLKVFTAEGAGLVKAAGAGVGRAFFPEISGRTDLDMYQKILYAITEGFATAAGGFKWLSDKLDTWIPDIAKWVGDIPGKISLLIEEVRHVASVIEIRASQLASVFSIGKSSQSIIERYFQPEEIGNLAKKAGEFKVSSYVPVVTTGSSAGGGYAREPWDIVREILISKELQTRLKEDPQSLLKEFNVSAERFLDALGVMGYRDFMSDLGAESQKHTNNTADIRANMGKGVLSFDGKPLKEYIADERAIALRSAQLIEAERERQEPWDKLGGWKKAVGGLGIIGIAEQVEQATVDPLDTLVKTYESAKAELNQKWEKLNEVGKAFDEWSDKYLVTNEKLTDDQFKSVEELTNLIKGADTALKNQGQLPEIYKTLETISLFTGGDDIMKRKLWEALQTRPLGAIKSGYLGLAETGVGYLQDSSWERDMRGIERDMADPRRTNEQRMASLDEWVVYQKDAYRAVLDNFNWSEEQKVQLDEVFKEKLLDIDEEYLQRQKELLDEQTQLWRDYCTDCVEIYRDTFSEGIFRTMRGEIDSLRDVFDSFVSSLQKRFADLATDWLFAQMGLGQGQSGGGVSFGSIFQGIGSLLGLGGGAGAATPALQANGGLSGGPYGWAITGETANIEANIPLRNGAVPVQMMGGASQAPVYVINTVDPPELVAAGLPSNARIIVSQIGNDLFRRGPLSRQMITAR
jgi:hypothetical protein